MGGSGSRHGEGPRSVTRKLVTYGPDGQVTDCLFCRIAAGGVPENELWYSDELVAVFVPRHPAARLHFL